MFSRIKNKKIKLLITVLSIFLFILILFGCINVYKSCKIINRQIDLNFYTQVKNIKDRENLYMKSIEKSVNYCCKIIEITLDDKTLNRYAPIAYKYDENKIPYISNYVDNIVKPVLLFSTRQTKNLAGVYFNFDYNLVKNENLVGIWYTSLGNDDVFNLTDSGLVATMFPENSEALKWYYVPKKNKIGVWSDGYIDDDLKVPVITYSKPVYLNKNFVGIVGIDLKINQLKHFVDKYNVYKNCKIYLVDNNEKVFFSKDYAPLTSTASVNKKINSFLKEYKKVSLKNDVKIIKNGTKLYAISELYNGFKLVVEVPAKSLYGEVNKLIAFTVYATIFSILISLIIAAAGYRKAKKINDELLQKEKLITIGTMTAEIAHEINNPLGYISCNMDTLKKFTDKINEFMINSKINFEKVANNESSLEAEVQAVRDLKVKLKIDFVMESIGDIIDETKDGLKKLSDVIIELKSYTKDDSKDDKTEQNLAEIIEESLLMLKKKTEGIQIQKNIENLPPINCHRNLLKQAFINLIDNSCQALREKNNSDKKIIIKAYKKGKNCLIEFEDNGSGIEKNKLKNIFEPFFTTKSYGQGTGLGLSIVNEIITEKHHGEIFVESKQNQGTKFIIKIPYKSERREYGT